MMSLWRRFLAALAFLTAMRMPPDTYADTDSLAESPPMFPLVGALIGLVVAGFDRLACILLPPPVVAVADLALVFFITQGLHFDGLLDTADGMFSSRSPERILEIMKDSRVGAMGVIVGILQTGLKIAAISSLSGEMRFLALLLAPALARYATVVGIAVFPYVRTGMGLGNVFKSKGRAAWIIVPGIFVLALAGGLAGERGGVSAAASAAAGLAVGNWVSGRLGGLTGDVYGAMCEIAETAVYLVFSARWLGGI